jgi:hypothetical protein
MLSVIKNLRKKPQLQSETILSDLIGLRQIRNGILVRNNGYILLLEILPVNFRLKSENEQDYIIKCYEELLKILKSPFQITVMARKADISGHLKYMERYFELEADAHMKRQIREYMTFAKEVSSKGAVSRRFILALPYMPPAGIKIETVSFDSASSTLYELKGRVKQCIEKCGNALVEPENPDQFAAEILYTLLNRKTSEIQSLPPLNGRFFI